MNRDGPPSVHAHRSATPRANRCRHAQPSAATGAVMQPATLRRYAGEAGFADVEILDIADNYFRFYRPR